MLPCPACKHTLSLRDAEGVVVDVCEGGCGGVWFDNFELKKVDEPHETAGETFIDVAVADGQAPDLRKRRNCPRCETIKMMRRYFSVKKQIEIDECAQCGGIWLDADELARIRGEFTTEAERVEAAQAHFSAEFDDQLDAARGESQAKLQKATRFAHMFNWIFTSRR